MHNGSSFGMEPVPGTSKENALQSSNYGRAALHETAIIGDDETLEALLRSGADRNAKDTQHGNTPLHEAAWRGYSRCVKLLCALPKQKAHKILLDIKAQKALLETKGALHSALLVTRNFGGFSALHLAAQNGHNQSCREILLAGADPDVQNNYGDTPLHTAARYGHAGAVRILISAKCDPQRVNLNGDTALHIAVAMGRRKLTRILLEAGCDKAITNAQGETVKDIAIRKNLVEIIAILDATKPSKSPHRDRSSSSSRHLSKEDTKRKSRRDKDSATATGGDGVPDPRYWSPYGCHYSPDPKDFPQPRLESLPKEPLQKGEQYYLDLAGNIRKGPIGVGNTCYCAPLFRHLEHRISKNKKSIKKYVEKVDHKLDALANRTDDQIENLTRSIIADRIRCEDKKLYLKSWLNRGVLQRQSLAPGKVSRELESTNTLMRCKSLEFIDYGELMSPIHKSTTSAGLSKSVDLLNCHTVTVHRDAELSDHEKTSSNAKNHPESDREKSSMSGAIPSSTEKSLSEGRKVTKFKISKEPKHIRLKKKIQSKRNKDETMEQDSLSEEYPDQVEDDLHTTFVTKRLEKLLLETKTMLEKEKLFQKIRQREEPSPVSREKIFEHIQASRMKDKGRSIEAEMELITKTLGESLNLDLKDDLNTSDENEEYVDDLNNEHFISTSFSQNVQAPSEDEDSQDGDPQMMQQQMMNDGFFINTEFNSPMSSMHQSPLTVRETPDICRTSHELNELKSRILGKTNWRSNVLRKSIEDLCNGTSNDVVDSKSVPSGFVKKIVSQIQTTPETQIAPMAPMPRLSLLNSTLIPRDAYFHELPNKPRTMVPRNRNPLPIDVNENDILRDELPPSKIVYSNLSSRIEHRPPIPIKPPHFAVTLPVTQSAETNNCDRDSQNDSGYSGRLYDNPTVHGAINGNLIEHKKENSHQTNNSKEQYYSTKIGASSLV